MSVEAKNSQIFIPHKPCYYVASGDEFQFYEWFLFLRGIIHALYAATSRQSFIYGQTEPISNWNC